jgi:hypothetical protein
VMVTVLARSIGPERLEDHVEARFPAQDGWWHRLGEPVAD